MRTTFGIGFLLTLCGCAAPGGGYYAPPPIYIPPAQFTPISTRPAQQVQQVQPAGVSAFWTGKSQIAQSVTGTSGFNCEYNYAGRIFWRMFEGSCPSSIQIK